MVIGYATYIRLGCKDLLDGKLVIRKGMTEELDRCNAAWEHACQGKIAAVISSGDIGVYGWPGPTYEVLLQAGWRPRIGNRGRGRSRRHRRWSACAAWYGRAADARLLLDLALRPADTVAGHRPPVERRGPCRFRCRPV